MAWTAPITFTAGNVLTAAQLNTNLRDNLNQTTPALASAAGQIFVSTAANAVAARTPGEAQVFTAETSASTTYGDLTTVGPAVTVTTGTKAIVFVTAWVSNSSVNGQSLMSYRVSGATTVGENDNFAMRWTSATASAAGRCTAVTFHTGLTAGSNVFTGSYRVLSGTGSWADRRLMVIPL